MSPILRVASIAECRLIDLPTIGDERGCITVAEAERDIPFAIQRIYHLYGVPSGGVRGGHAHRRLQQVIVAVSGACDIVVDDGRSTRRVRLDRPDEGLFLPTMIWRTMDRFDPHTVALVLASEPYDADDYIRDYDDFLREADR